MKAIGIKIERLINPIGIDVQCPEITWTCDGGKKQTAYRILAKSKGVTVWDSGTVHSASMSAVYEPKLISRQRVELSVILTDENGAVGEEAYAFFEMGLLESSDFKAKWITGNYKVNRKKRYPADNFKKCFNVKDVKSARLYATACGIYEAKINGKRVGDFVLAPGITNYKKRVQYQTYDVTPLIQNGENIIEATLSDGWYRGSVGAWGLRNQYGTETKLWMQLEIVDKNGEEYIVCTDESFSWSCDGSVRFADNKDGEVYDARCIPSYNCKAKLTKHAVLPSASNNVFIKEHERFLGKCILTPKGKRVIDFGQNIAGYVELSFYAKAGERLHMRFGEILGSDGEFTQSNIQLKWEKTGYVTPKQEIIYTAKDGFNHYKTAFAIFGFRYMLIEGDIDVSVDDITAIAVYSDLEQTLTFDSSHTLINKFVENTRWSAKNNHADLPTDCPTRERHGWTGDAQIFSGTAGYFFDYSPFARKYVRMLKDDQKKSGKILQIVPYGGVDFYMSYMNGCAGWSDAEIIIPYRMWKLRGDSKIIRDNLDAMKKYADYTIAKIGKWYPSSTPTGAVGKGKKYVLNYGQAYGEWAEPDDVKAMHWTDFVSPKPEVATAYASYVLSLMAEICEHLGDPAAQRYREYAKNTRMGYIALSHGKKFPLDTDRQARLVRAIYFDLLDKEDMEFAKLRLVKALDNYGWRVGTGFLSTPLILFVLGNINIEYAYRLLENEEMPGWLYMPKHGATTIWEAWEGDSSKSGGIGSLNHYSKGAVCEWIFSEMCGVKIDGERRFRIAPKVGGTLTHAALTYNSAYGKVMSAWRRDGDVTSYTVSIPANTTATLLLPDGERILDAGEYEFVLKK